MTDELYGTQSSLQNVEAGAPVYDLDSALLGTVADVYTVNDPFLDAVASALRFAKIIPPAVAYVRKTGCFVVDTGLYAGNYYILPNQIRKITEAGIYLNCNCIELIQV